MAPIINCPSTPILKRLHLNAKAMDKPVRISDVTVTNVSPNLFQSPRLPFIIAVSLVGNNHPIGVILSAFLFGVLQKGGPLMQIQGIPKEVVGIIQGIIILFVAANFVKVVTENIKLNRELKKQTVKEEVE
jgi:hypothetical protein